MLTVPLCDYVYIMNNLSLSTLPNLSWHFSDPVIMRIINSLSLSTLPIRVGSTIWPVYCWLRPPESLGGGGRPLDMITITWNDNRYRQPTLIQSSSTAMDFAVTIIYIIILIYLLLISVQRVSKYVLVHNLFAWILWCLRWN